jgi:hypothetical protein
VKITTAKVGIERAIFTLAEACLAKSFPLKKITPGSDRNQSFSVIYVAFLQQ